MKNSTMFSKLKLLKIKMNSNLTTKIKIKIKMKQNSKSQMKYQYQIMLKKNSHTLIMITMKDDIYYYAFISILSLQTKNNKKIIRLK